MIQLGLTLAAALAAATVPSDSVRPTVAPLPAAAVASAMPGSLAGPRRQVRFTEAALSGLPEPVADGIAPEPPGAPLAAPAPADTPVARTRAIEHSDAYYTRLQVHRYGSYVILPLFAAEYFLGQNLLNSYHPASWVRPAHRVAAYGVAGVFGVNTVTGVWNLWDARHDSQGRTRRLIHVATMLASDAGFVAVGQSVHQAKLTSDGARRHRNLALGAIGLSAASTIYMWLTK